MNTISRPMNCAAVWSRPVRVLASLTAAALSLALQAQTTAVPENFVTFAGGGSLLEGDRAQFQKQRNEDKTGWYGVENFHYVRDLGNNTSLTAKGRALIGNNNFAIDLRLTREDVGYVRVGYQQYRLWFDGSGGFFAPTNLFFEPYDNILALDRGNFWVEMATTRPEQMNFKFRYDYTFREGHKNSTSWGDTNLTGGLGTRAIVPAHMDIRENRHIVSASAFREAEDMSWQVQGRYERQDQDNARHMRRQPLAPQDRFLTQREGSDVDLFMVHGAFESRIGPALALGAGVAHYNLDNTLSGSRIYGDTYDPVFNPTMTRRQQRDEGFYDLSGTTHMRQSLASVNLMYTPSENWVIVPELRAQRNTWGGEADFIETNVGAPPALTTVQDELHSQSGKSYRELTEALEFRYMGVRDVALNAAVQATQSYGTLAEDLIEHETGIDQPYRTTGFRRDEQKVEFSAHWYPLAGLNFSGQVYHKARQNSFRNSRTSTAPLGADRYPAYIANQDLEVNDLNVRVSWSPLIQLRSVTRYDYQEAKLRSQEIGLPFINSGRVRTHMLSETMTWSPGTRWYLQASGNLVFDQTTSPVNTLTGPAAGLVQNGDNNYFNGDIVAGIALDEKSDLTLNYAYYRAENFVDNYRVSQPYGAEERTHFVGAAWFHRANAYTNYTVRYVYGKHDDMTSGDNNNFEAHTIYASMQYRF